MINASDFLNNPIENLKKVFREKNNKIKFIRLACHYNEIFLTEDIINGLRREIILFL